MSVLWLQPNWYLPSELWMQRMLQMVAPHLCAVCANYVPDDRWNGIVPAFALEPEYSVPERIALRLGLLKRGWYRKGDILSCLLRQLQPKKIFVHYLTFALEFEPVLTAYDAEIFVHCHGFDVTWDLRLSTCPGTPFFPDTYCGEVRKLSEWATIIANSETSKQSLVHIGVPPERILLKYLSVPVPKVGRVHRKRNCVQIMYLGRLIDFKGPDLTIKAFEIACDRGLEGELVIAGDGDMRMTCESMRRRSRYGGRIHLLGAVDAETGAMLRQESDIFAAHNCVGPVTRQTEALGVSVLEAMADALPVVTGRSGGVTETVVEGVTGILVEPGDLEAHAEALLSLAADPKRRRVMGEAGRQRVIEKFSVEREKRELLKILGLPG